MRVIGFSETAEMLLVVILLPGDYDDDRPDGDWWGVNAWPAGERDRRLYGRE